MLVEGSDSISLQSPTPSDGGAPSPNDAFRLDGDVDIDDYPRSEDGASAEPAQLGRPDEWLPSMSSLPPLDLDELSPLPPARRMSLSPKSRAHRSSPPLAKESGANASSSRSSPMLTSFLPDDSPQHRPRQRSHSPQPLRPQSTASSKSSLFDAGPSELCRNSVPAARYVTVSAILSRSELYFSAGTEHVDLLRGTLNDSADSEIPAIPRRTSAEKGAVPSCSLRRRSTKKAPSNGSALEALGALLLHRDSSGKVSSLSLASNADDAVRVKRSVIQSWTHALNEIGRTRLGLNFPATGEQGGDVNVRGTIAERRAKKRGHLLDRRAGANPRDVDGFKKVCSPRETLSFEVGTPHNRHSTHAFASTDFGAGASIEEEPFGPTRPGTIVLKAGKRPTFPDQRSEVCGSSLNAFDLPEAPPSPVAMPGAWHGGSAWRSKPGEGFDEGALLLPPPLLDDQGSDSRSFEGLLGVRRMREEAKARKLLERLKARNRPTHKVGPLTALLNFVKAAHAAEASAKRAQDAKRRPRVLTRSLSHPEALQLATADEYIKPPALSRTQTGPARGPFAFDDEDGTEFGTIGAEACRSRREDPTRPAVELQHASVTVSYTAEIEDGLISTGHTAVADSVKLPPSISPRLQAARRRQASLSVDATGRQLNTVFESGSFDPVTAPEASFLSPESVPVTSPLLRPSSTASSMSGRDLPSAPRLLPIQMSLPPSPFTPLGIDHQYRSQSTERRSSGSSLASDYWSARPLPNLHAPQTPRLVPTSLSIPPSPWTPHQGGSSAPMYQLHLNTSISSSRLPGTPRLIPTHLEVLPSPFPTPMASRRASISVDKGAASSASVSSHLLRDVGRSSLSRSQDEPHQIPSYVGHDLDPPVRVQARLAAASTEPQRARARKTRLEEDASESGLLARLTPLNLLRESGSATVTPTLHHHRGTWASSLGQSQDHLAAPGRKLSSDQRGEDANPDCQRSFVLWFLIGDLGLRPRRSEGASVQDDLGGVAGVVVHVFGFAVFCIAHLVDLGYQVAESAALAFWFFRWLYLNGTGQTVLARCALEAYRLIQAEWATVAEEDHEARGAHKRRDRDGETKAKGLTRWQVLRGLFELFCLHSVTRERYHKEGAGLVELEGWSTHKNRNHATRTANVPPGSDRFDVGAQKAAPRVAPAEASAGSTAGSEDVGRACNRFDHEGEGNEAGYDDHDGDQQDNDDANHDEDDDSSDDEMIVTNRGHDILEFSKTPRLDPIRPSQQRKQSGYFGTSYDAATSPAFRPSASDVAGELKPLRESPRELIRTVKWASRLAISAYGLHVHIVDLPPTFTPSGDRFSRQTFAYLSRLNAEDVLHADIQTLDVEADYSPTFYIVRDYVRKVVCVAVRGTQSFSDIIVDLEMQTEQVELPQVQPAPGEEFRCHTGIWRAAKALVSPDSKLFEKLCVALEENEGFGVIFCGHSLGGAIASAAALLLGEYRIPDGAKRDQGSWFTNMSSGLPAHRPIRAISFANPVTMTADLASRAAMGSIPLVTSVILGSDIIPRAGHGQVRELRRMLGALSRVRRRHAISSSTDEDARVHIVQSYWDWRSICNASNPDGVMLDRKERIEEQLWSLRREVESELYAAVKSRHNAAGEDGMGKGRGDVGSRIPPSPWVGPQQRDAAPLHELATRRQALDSATLRSEAAQGGPLIPPGKCLWIEGKAIYLVTSPLSFFSLPEFRADMFAMHFPAAYEEAILNLRT